MKVLVACEESQAVCKAFRERGHEAYSCDIQECSGGHPEWHIMQDVVPLLNGNCEFETADGEKHTIDGEWDMIIAHPPCTFMSKAGARWMYPKAGQIDQARFQKARAARAFFMKIWRSKCNKIIIENPTPLRCVKLPEPTQKIQPFQYDPENKHPYTKATLLWIKGDVPPLRPTTPKSNPVCTWMPSNTSKFSKGKGGGKGIAHDPKTASKTFSGIAQAMAEQWG